MIEGLGELSGSRMDIILQTYTDDPALALIGITRFPDGSGYVSRLRVRSNGFLLDRDFCFDEFGITKFVDAILSMDETLTGTAKLRTEYEDHFIRLEVSPRGQVTVGGEIREYSDLGQFLRFGFKTDQTVLGPFARDLEKLCHLADT